MINNLLLVLLYIITLPVQAERHVSDVFELSLEELGEVQVVSTSTLTKTSARKAPAAITTITQEDIRLSGARNLDELLDIYVPGFQYMKKSQTNQIGIRGIISDRNNKMLMVVNGRNMNIKVRDGGALTERNLSMLGDIKQISVIRGPGSSVYGPGAIAGIINIETFSGSNFEGTEITIRGGEFETFVNGEIKYGKKLTDDLGLFAYYGVDRYYGAEQSDSPLIFSHDFTAGNGQAIIAGEPTPFAVVNQNASFEDRLRHKAHLQLTGDNFDLWARYTLGGTKNTSIPRVFRRADPASLFETGQAYQQITLFASYEQTINDMLKLDYRASYDLADIQISGTDHWREDEYTGRVMAYLDINPQHEITVGGEISYEIFGKESLFKSGQPSDITGLPLGTDWETTMYSLLGEYQWTINDQWLAITGIRADNHTYTPWMISPRAALIYTPNNRDTIKAIANHSVRRSDDGNLFKEKLERGTEGEVESIDNFELRYERQHSKTLWLAASAYYNDHSVISFDSVALKSTNIGDLKTYGLELEAKYQTADTSFLFSHNYTKLLDFNNTRGTTLQNLSASPYGFGDDLANWSNHSSKLSLEHSINDQWTGTASMRIYWGYQGAEDLANYNAAVLGSNDNAALYDSSTRAFEESIYLNMGLEYHPNKNTTIRLDGFNLLGLIDDELNKRNFFQRSGKYRVEAPAIALSVKVKLWD